MDFLYFLFLTLVSLPMGSSISLENRFQQRQVREAYVPSEPIIHQLIPFRVNVPAVRYLCRALRAQSKVHKMSPPLLSLEILSKQTNCSQRSDLFQMLHSCIKMQETLAVLIIRRLLERTLILLALLSLLLHSYKASMDLSRQHMLRYRMAQ